ncbi:hypothetical protein SNEBB_001855 [Seison nebaliae]|nr:hypothetical protein SNEBB_001855 [Seison nebaliae]
MFNIFRCNLYRRYYVPYCSCAFVYYLVSLILIIFLPLVFLSFDYDSYRHQDQLDVKADIEYLDKFSVIYQHINTNDHELILKSNVLQNNFEYQFSWNKQSQSSSNFDKYNLQLFMNLGNDIDQFILILYFRYLVNHNNININLTIPFIKEFKEIQSDFIGKLKFHSKVPLVSAIDQNSIPIINPLDVAESLKLLWNEKYLLELNTIQNRRRISTSKKRIEINGELIMNNQLISVTTTYWKRLKWILIQYFLYFIPFYLLFNYLNRILFERRVFSSCTIRSDGN